MRLMSLHCLAAVGGMSDMARAALLPTCAWLLVATLPCLLVHQPCLGTIWGRDALLAG